MAWRNDGREMREIVLRKGMGVHRGDRGWRDETNVAVEGKWKSRSERGVKGV